jgi:hypothetical protein
MCCPLALQAESIGVFGQSKVRALPLGVAFLFTVSMGILYQNIVYLIIIQLRNQKYNTVRNINSGRRRKQPIVSDNYCNAI